MVLQCWELEPVNRPTFANIVGALSDSLQAMAGYLDVGAFGENTVERNECRETLELVEEQSSCNCQASNAMASQTEATVPNDESTI